MGKIVLKEMEFQAYHGYYAEEAQVGHIFVVDVELDYDLEKAAQNDDLSKTVDYQVVYNLIASDMKVPSKLIENLALRVKTSIQKEYPNISDIKIQISKINPPVGGKIHSATIIY